MAKAVTGTKRKVETLAQILDQRLGEISATKSQSEVSREMGFPTPNFLSMIKKGRSKLALGRVGHLAEALDMDLDRLFIAALRQYYDEETIALMEKAFGGPISKGEREILDIARAHGDMRKGLTGEARQAIASALTHDKQTVQ